MAEITETEVVVPNMRKVKLGSETFKVPPSPTLKYMFWIRKFVRQFQEGTVTDDDLFECYEQTVDFLRRYNKNVDEERLQETCEITDLISFYSSAFGQSDAEADGDEDDAGPPARRATRGGATPRGSKTSARTRSRSST